MTLLLLFFIVRITLDKYVFFRSCKFLILYRNRQRSNKCDNQSEHMKEHKKYQKIYIFVLGSIKELDNIVVSFVGKVNWEDTMKSNNKSFQVSVDKNRNREKCYMMKTFKNNEVMSEDKDTTSELFSPIKLSSSFTENSFSKWPFLRPRVKTTYTENSFWTKCVKETNNQFKNQGDKQEKRLNIQFRQLKDTDSAYISKKLKQESTPKTFCESTQCHKRTKKFKVTSMTKASQMEASTKNETHNKFN